MTTVGGDGVPGFINGSANMARFALPHGIAVDSDANVFVTEMGNHAVRKISRSGMVSTVAVAGTAGFTDGS